MTGARPTIASLDTDALRNASMSHAQHPQPQQQPSRLSRFGARILRTRWIVRMPIYAFRLHLGFLFGNRLLMLEHRGRTSGKRRYVVLEVVDHPAKDAWMVASGFGSQSNWVKNVQANPTIRLWVGRHVAAPATAIRLTNREATEALHAYAENHPQAWQRLRPVFEETLGAQIDESGTDLPLYRLTLA